MSPVAVLVGLALLIAAVAGCFVIGMRTRSPLLLRPLVAISKRVMNPLQLRTAGRPGAYAGIVRHVGRVTGRGYATPVGIIRVEDAFLVALPYGSRTQWLRNVLAAGRAEIVVEGATHLVDRPELVPTADHLSAFSPTDRRLFRLLAVDSCLRLWPADS